MPTSRGDVPGSEPTIPAPQSNIQTQFSSSPLTETQVKDLVSNRFESGRQAAIPFITRAAKYYRLFRNQQTVRNYTGLAQLFVPEPYRIVAKKTAKLGNSIKAVHVTPETPNDEDAADIAEHLLNFLRRKLNWNTIERIAIQESRVVGMSWIKVLWDTRVENAQAPYKGFDLSFDTVDHVILPPDLTVQEILSGKIPWLVHYYQADLSELRKNPNYDPEKLSILEQRAGNTGSRRSQATVLEQARVMFTQAQRQYTVKQSKKFNIYEYWGYLPNEITDQTGFKKTEQFDSLVVIADRDVVLRNTSNPYASILDERIPFVPIVARIVGQETWPVGDIEPSESLFNELNDTRNQRMDTVTLGIDPMKIVMRGANIDDKDLVARRGWIVKSSLPGSQAVQVVPVDMAGAKAAIDEEKIIRGDIQQVTGVIDFAQGSEVQAGVEIDTARGALIAKGESDIMSEEDLDLLKISLQKLYRIVLAYSQTFLDRPFMIRLLQRGIQSFEKISSDRIRGNLDLDIEMQTLQDKTTQQQLKLLLLNQARETPGANVGRFFTDALESLTDGEIQIQEYYQPPQPQPEQPKVSISLKGDLTELQASQVYKTIPGVDPEMGDPLMTGEGRLLAKGIHKEDLDVLEKQQNIINSQQQNAQSSSSDAAQSSNA